MFVGRAGSAGSSGLYSDTCGANHTRGAARRDAYSPRINKQTARIEAYPRFVLDALLTLLPPPPPLTTLSLSHRAAPHSRYPYTRTSQPALLLLLPLLILPLILILSLILILLLILLLLLILPLILILILILILLLILILILLRMLILLLILIISESFGFLLNRSGDKANVFCEG